MSYNEDTEYENSSNEKIKKKKKQPSFKFPILIGVIVLFFIFKPYYILNEGETAIITKFGEVVKTETNAGIHFKAPIIHTVHKYTAKLLRLDGDPQKILTKEKQFIEVDTTSRWRITDIRKFYESVVTYQGAFSRLSDIIDSSVRDVITINSLANIIRNSNIINEEMKEKQSGKENSENDTEGKIGKDGETDNTLENEEAPDETGEIQEKIVFIKITKGREVLADEILTKANAQLGEFGIEVIDIIFKQIKYSDELENSVFNRMIKDRNQIAQTHRSTGEGKKAEWLGKLENEKKTILSKAYAESEQIKGAADARAVSIYANAYGKSPEFYSFWKSIEIYKQSLPKTEKILSTDMEYFKYLYRH